MSREPIRFIVMGPDGVTVDGKPYTPKVVKLGEPLPDDGLPYLMEEEPYVQRTRDGKFYVGQRVRLNDQGYKQCPIQSAQEARAALDTRITAIQGPMAVDDAEVYAVDLEGLDPYLLTTDDIEPKERS